MHIPIDDTLFEVARQEQAGLNERRAGVMAILDGIEAQKVRRVCRGSLMSWITCGADAGVGGAGRREPQRATHDDRSEREGAR